MSSTSFFPTTTSSSSPTQSSNNNNNNNRGGSNPGSFYKNLFYILIGLLAAFGLVSFLSLMRARKRRHAIVREAERLGVIVPGIPGYIPLRDRRNLNWLKSDGTSHPDWWEIEKLNGDQKEKDQIVGGSSSDNQTRMVDGGNQDEFHPLAIIPPKPEEPKSIPIPLSTLPYFPNHLAYRPESLIPPPSKFHSSDPGSNSNSSHDIDPSIYNELIGEKIELITIIKMPIPPDQLPKPKPPRGEGDDDDDEEDPEGVLREWSGIELGITNIGISHGYRGWED